MSDPESDPEQGTPVPQPCPHCGHHTLMRSPEARLYCLNPFCDSNHPPTPQESDR